MFYLNWPFPASLSFIFVSSKLQRVAKKSSMTSLMGFELRTSEAGTETPPLPASYTLAFIRIRAKSAHLTQKQLINNETQS